MADREPTDEPTDEPRRSLLVRAREWTMGSRLRSALVAGGLLGLMGVTVAVWLVLASLAAPQQVTSLESALERLDAGDLELAATLVKKIQDEQAILTRDYGGPLFVLGAVRARQAEAQWAPARRRRDYLIAAKYLDEARSLGVPEDREYEALYLLGKAYIGSDQLEEGVALLSEALNGNPEHRTEIHSLLAQAHYHAKYPDYEQALDHLDQVLADDSAPAALRAESLLQKARVLARLGRHEEVGPVLGLLPPEANPAKAKLVEGHSLVRSAESEADPTRRADLLTRAEAALADSERLDKLATSVSAAAQYLRGQISRLRGDPAGALQRFTDVRKRFGATAAAVASSVAEGDLLRRSGDNSDALTAYRRALDAVAEMTSYQSDLLPTADLRTRVLAARDSFIAAEDFEAALNLVEQIRFMVGETEGLELRAETQSDWGERLLERSLEMNWPSPSLQREGRLRLREAGVSFERLADERFSTVKYPDDLWRAAEAYYRGQSYTNATRLLQDYLKNEPLRRNANALLLLGKSLLALGRPDEAARAFDECIEFHPSDAAVYGSRLASARALRDQGRLDEAEVLLRDNLERSPLTPRSPEWRDSEFELGSLLHETGRHAEAVNYLEDAILRYPGARQNRLARYVAAESYRSAAEEPRQRFELAKAVNEREEAEREFRDLLGRALKHYDSVQREISTSNSSAEIDQAMLRNCYMLKGSVLFDLGRYREAVEEYSNVSALYQNEPFVLETLVQISYCWRRLGERAKARGNVEQALLALERMPPEADYLASTTRSRDEWRSLLNDIRDW